MSQSGTHAQPQQGTSPTKSSVNGQPVSPTNDQNQPIQQPQGGGSNGQPPAGGGSGQPPAGGGSGQPPAGGGSGQPPAGGSSGQPPAGGGSGQPPAGGGSTTAQAQPSANVPQGANQSAQTNSNPNAPLTPDEKNTIISDKLVDEYKRNKEKRHQDEKEDANPPAGAAQQQVAAGASAAQPQSQDSGGESLGDKADKWADRIGMVNDVASDGLSLYGGSVDITRATHHGTDSEGNRIGNKTIGGQEQAIQAANAVTGTVDLGLNIYGLARNSYKSYQANKGHNRRKKRRAGFNVASSVFNTLGSATNLASTGFAMGSLGAYGKQGADSKTGDALGTTSTALGVAGSSLGFIGSALEMAGAAADVHSNKKIISKADAYMGEAGLDTALSGSKDSLASARAAEKTGGKYSAAQKQAIADAKKQRDTAKAKKFAMQYAKQNAEVNKLKAAGDTTAAAGGAFSNLMGIGAGIGGLISGGIGTRGAGLGGAIAGLGLGVLGMAAKWGTRIAGKAMNKKAESNERTNKTKTMEDYLNSKKDKIKNEGKSVDIDGHGTKKDLQLTDTEAKKIALARLGVAVSTIGKMSGDEGPSSAALDAGFNLLMRRRARNILNSSTKADMLNVLGLGADATEDEVAEMLGAGG